MKRFDLVLVASLAALVAGATAAPAADFTFNVPVDAQSIEAEFTEGRVECAVEGGGTAMGSGEQFFALDSFGDFQETLTILVNVADGQDPADASRYECNLTLRNSSGQFVAYDSIADSGGRRTAGVGRLSGTLGSGRR